MITLIGLSVLGSLLFGAGGFCLGLLLNDLHKEFSKPRKDWAMIFLMIVVWIGLFMISLGLFTLFLSLY